MRGSKTTGCDVAAYIARPSACSADEGVSGQAEVLCCRNDSSLCQRNSARRSGSGIKVARSSPVWVGRIGLQFASVSVGSASVQLSMLGWLGQMSHSSSLGFQPQFPLQAVLSIMRKLPWTFARLGTRENELDIRVREGGSYELVELCMIAAELTDRLFFGGWGRLILLVPAATRRRPSLLMHMYPCYA